MKNLVFRCIITIIFCCQVTSIQQVYYSTPVPTIIDEGVNHYMVAIMSLCSKSSPQLDSHIFRLHLRLQYTVTYYRRRTPKDVRIGIASYDVCHNSSLLLRVLSELLLSKGFRTDSALDDLRNNQSNVICLVSYMTFSLTKLLTQILSDEPFPIFTIVHGDISTFENIKPSFFSTNKIIAENMLVVDKQISRYHIKHVSLVIIREKNSHFLYINRHIMWKKLLKHPGICISMKDLNSNNYTEIENYMDEVKRNNNLKMIITWYVTDAYPLLAGINQHPLENVLNLTKTTKNCIWYWITDVDILYPRFSTINLPETHVFIPGYVTSAEHFYWRYNNYDVMLENHFQIEDYDKLLNDRWVSRYMNENNLNRTSSTVFTNFNEQRNKIDLEIETTFMLIKGLGEYSNIGDMWKKIDKSIHDKMRRRFDNKAKEIEMIQNYKGLLRDNENNFIGKCKRMRCIPGYESNKMIFNFSRSEKKFNWNCLPCPDGYIKPTYSNYSCTKCHDKLITNNARTMCYDPYSEEYMAYGDMLSVILLVMTIPVAIFNMAGIFTFLTFRDTPIVKSNGANSSIVQLVAHLLVFIEIFILFFGKVNYIVCVAQIVVSGHLLTVIMSITIGKTQKLVFAFQSKVRIDQNTVLISKATEIFISLVCVIVQAIISFVSFLDNNPETQTFSNHQDLSRMTFCKNKIHFLHQFLFVILLSVFCCVQAFRSRNLPNYYNQTAQIIYAMYIIIIIIIVRFLIIYIHHYVAQTFLDALFILLINNTLLLLGFSQSIFIALFRKEVNTVEHFRSIIMENIKAKTSDEIEKRIRINVNEPGTALIQSEC